MIACPVCGMSRCMCSSGGVYETSNPSFAKKENGPGYGPRIVCATCGLYPCSPQCRFNHVDTTNPKDLIGAQKIGLTKLPPVALLHANHAMMNGEIKYGPYNWRQNKVQATIYIDAAMRHLLAWHDREETADDSGVHHLGHAMACCAILLDAQASVCLVDDRPQKAGSFNITLKKLNELEKTLHKP